MKTIRHTIQTPDISYDFPHPVSQTAFLDIETTGLSPKASSLYLIGLMQFDTKKEEWTLIQWFADNYQSEKDMLYTLLEHLSDICYLYHFNGRTFDIPYLLKKCNRHAIPLSEHCQKLLQDTTGMYSIDLLCRIRSLRHTLLLDKCNQTAVESWLGIRRTDPFTGEQLITVYSEYMQQKLLNPGNADKLEQVLLLHNYEDIEKLLSLCSLLTYDEYLSESCTNRLLSKQNIDTLVISDKTAETITLKLSLPISVPKKLSLTASYPAACSEENPPLLSLQAASLTLSGTEAVFVLPLYEGTLKYFFADFKNYYYLPKEDMAIHKSVAEFVDSSFRRKATAASCYTKKSGSFLPNLSPAKKTKQNPAEESLPLFYQNYKDKLSFCELPEDFATNHSFWKAYLCRQLPMFR